MKRFGCSRKQKGAVGACCLVFVVLLLMGIIGLVVFYFAVWKVPDQSQAIEPVFKRVETRITQKSNVPSDKNAWTYYKEAVDNMDLSKIKSSSPSPSSSSHPSTQQYQQNFGYISTLSSLLRGNPSKEELKSHEDLLGANSEVFKKVDEGFGQPVFYMPPTQYNQKNYHKTAADKAKIQVLGYLLILSGDFEKSLGRDRTAAKRYLESLYLADNVTDDLFGAMSAVSRSFGNVALQRLRMMMQDRDVKSDTARYVMHNLKRMDPSPMNEFLEDICYDNERMMDLFSKGINNPKAPRLPGFLVDRERNVSREYFLRIIKEQEKDPVNFIDKLKTKTIKARPVSVYGAILPIMTPVRCESHLDRIAQMNGLEILTAIKLFKLKNGEYPAALKDLVPGYIPALPEDPYAADGKFGYKLKKKSYKLYSLGVNHTDDAGSSDDVMISGKKIHKAPTYSRHTGKTRIPAPTASPSATPTPSSGEKTGKPVKK